MSDEELKILLRLLQAARRVLWVKDGPCFSIAERVSASDGYAILRGPDSRSTCRADWDEFGRAIHAAREIVVPSTKGR